MPHIDGRSGEVIIRIVYDGAPEAGKTTNLAKLGSLMSLQRIGAAKKPGTSGDRTEFFDWLDFTGGYLDGRRVRCQLVSVPGQSALLHRRRYLLEKADAIVYVADSRPSHFGSAIASFATTVRMAERLAPPPLPLGVILQANKQDLPDALSPTDVAKRIGTSPMMPVIGSVAARGDGVMQTFILAVRLATERVRALLLKGELGAFERDTDSPEALFAALLELEKSLVANAGAIPSGLGPPALEPPNIEIVAIDDAALQEEATSIDGAVPPAAEAVVRDAPAQAVPTPPPLPPPPPRGARASRTVKRFEDPFGSAWDMALDDEAVAFSDSPTLQISPRRAPSGGNSTSAKPGSPDQRTGRLPPVPELPSRAHQVRPPSTQTPNETVHQSAESRAQTEQGVRERAAREQLEREQAEQQARAKAEQAAREQEEQLARAKAEQAAREQVEQLARAKAEQAAREQAEREQAEREQVEREQAAREQAEQLAREKAEQAAREQAEQQARAKAEQAEREQAEREQAELLAREKAEQAAREKAEQAHAAREQVARAFPQRSNTLRIEEMPALPNAAEIASGHVWPPVRGRASVSVATSGRITVPASVQPWAPVDAFELISDTGWLLHSSPRWLYESESVARHRLLACVRGQISRGGGIPEGRTLVVARDRDRWRLWLLTPQIEPLSQRLVAALDNPDAAATSLSMKEVVMAMRELRELGLGGEEIAAGIAGLTLHERKLAVLPLDEGEGEPRLESREPFAQLAQVIDASAPSHAALRRWFEDEGRVAIERASSP